jgi:enoyl-CoA hydratase
MDIDVSFEGHVAIVTYSNPPVNAIGRPGFLGLTATFRELGERSSVRAIVLTGAGTRAFIAGADLKLADVTKTEITEEVVASQVTDSGSVARNAFEAVLDCGVPVIAAVNGPALGAGLAYVSVSDFVIAVETARFGMTEINIGLLGGGSHLMRILGIPRARKMFLTGRQVPAAEFHEWGIVDEIVEPDHLLPTALELAATMAAKSPLAVRLAKESLNRIEMLNIRDAYRIEQDYTRRLMRFEDAAEARLAFVEKRPPEWKWR